LIEDFAHHPTAVEQTVSSIAERFPNTRVFAVFEPRSATSCRKIFQQPYFEALKQAKTVVIVPPNAFREIPLEEQLSPSQLIEDLRNAGIDAHSFPKVDEVVAFLKREAKPEDVVLLMSNGAFGGIYQKLLATL
jgi:UDP-N-acetylmuramate: L-alanyl-gamma-D-glutamyl-meso-diaminopimelate ligase